MIELKNIFLFQELTTNQLQEIKQFSKVLNLKKNEQVFYQGDNSDYLFILIKGESSIYKLDNKGNEIIIHQFSAPTLLAERANLMKIPYPANCKMDSDGIVLKVEFEKLKTIMQNSDVCFKIMQSLLKKMSSLENMIDNNLLDTETKIAKFIYENSEAFENLKQHSIASLLNIKPETLSRKLKKLKDLNIIENKNSKLKVLNKEKLRDMFSW